MQYANNTADLIANMQYAYNNTADLIANMLIIQLTL